MGLNSCIFCVVDAKTKISYFAIVNDYADRQISNIFVRKQKFRETVSANKLRLKFFIEFSISYILYMTTDYGVITRR